MELFKKEEKKKRRITILGMGQTASERKHDIARYCEGTEIWGLNNGYCFFPNMSDKWDRFFELHSWDYLRKWNAGNGINCHFTELELLCCPIYATCKLPVIENQFFYDTLEICRHFDTNYFLGSPSLMLMLALYEHDKGSEIEYIQSYGIDTLDELHMQQKTSWAYWLHEATDRGIEIGGTACNFMLEPERDEGLKGLRIAVGKEMEKEINNKEKGIIL